MSYEECEEHGTDATNGCAECEKEHRHSLCCHLATRLEAVYRGEPGNTRRLLTHLTTATLEELDSVVP